MAFGINRLFSFFKSVLSKISRNYNKLYNSLIFTFFKVQHEDYKIFGRIFIRNSGQIYIGSNFKANSGIRHNPIGGDTILRIIACENAKILIGKNVGISNSSLFSQIRIEIHDNVLIGGGCKIWDTDFHSLDLNIRGSSIDFYYAKHSPVIIKANAFIGSSSIILKGVIVGEGAIIAAGSVVSKSIPNHEMWGGNPAKFIRKLK